MKRIFLTFFALVLSVGLGLSDAEAKRLGGGKSTGVQRESATQQAPAQPQQSINTPANPNMAGAAAGQVAKKNSWLGPVAGLAAGLGLAALASHLGFGEGLANIMMIALLVMGAVLLFRFFARKRSQPAPAMQYAGMGTGGGMVPLPPESLPASSAPLATAPAATAPAATAPAASAPALPASFDAAAFVREAKLNFLRLQAANDAGNLDDLREFTTPEMFAEIQLQLRERGDAAQRTEVVQLNGEVMECVEEAQRYLVSVRFHGLIREEADASPAHFDEVWHLTKPIDGSRGWAIAGIQQRN